MSAITFRIHQPAAYLNIVRLCHAKSLLCTKVYHPSPIKNNSTFGMVKRKLNNTMILHKNKYHSKTHYLPYVFETPEQIEHQNNVINYIDTLAAKKINKSHNDKETNVSMSYKQCIQKETKFIPLNIRPERKELLEDWNEVLAIITEMKVVPEEADQVALF